MMKSTFQEQVFTVGRYTNNKIGKIQSDWLSSEPSAKARARAKLAELRRLGADAHSPWMSFGDILFEDWPEEQLGIPDDSSKALLAVSTALQLYAIHQQSQSQGVALFIDGKTPQEKSYQQLFGAFGRACRRINPDLDTAKVVRRKLTSIETAQNFEIAVTHLRALVTLMKNSKLDNSNNKQIDYQALAQDLFLIQFEKTKDSVFLKWSKDYFSKPIQNNNSDNNK